MEKASIPYVEGLSQEIRRIVRAAGVRCSFYTPDTMRNLYQEKDVLPQELSTHVVYSVNCKTCDAEYVGDTAISSPGSEGLIKTAPPAAGQRGADSMNDVRSLPRSAAGVQGRDSKVVATTTGQPRT